MYFNLKYVENLKYTTFNLNLIYIVYDKKNYFSGYNTYLKFEFSDNKRI